MNRRSFLKFLGLAPAVPALVSAALEAAPPAEPFDVSGISDVMRGEVAATSPDGVTWTARSLEPSEWKSIALRDGVWVAVR